MSQLAQAQVGPQGGGGGGGAVTSAPLSGAGTAVSPATLPITADPQVDSIGVGRVATGVAGDVDVNNRVIVRGSGGAAIETADSSSDAVFNVGIIATTFVNGTTDVRKGGVSIIPLAATILATPPNIVSCTDTSGTITGAATTNTCVLSVAGVPPTNDLNTVASCYVSAANTVQIHLCSIAALVGVQENFNVRILP